MFYHHISFTVLNKVLYVSTKCFIHWQHIGKIYYINIVELGSTMQIVLNITTFFLAMYSALRQGEAKLVLYFATYGADLTFDRDNTCCCTGGWFISRQHYDSEKYPIPFIQMGFCFVDCAMVIWISWTHSYHTPQSSYFL